MQKLLLIFIGFLLILPACSISKRVSYHENLLQSTLVSDIDAEQKMDILGESLVKMMNDGLDFVNPKKGARFVKEYGVANEPNINALLKEIGQWQDQMSTLERVSFAVSLLQKPYVKDLVNLIPRFKRKYNQIVFVDKLTNNVSNQITDFRKEKIGF